MKCGDLDATFYLAHLIDFGTGGVRQDKILARVFHANAVSEEHADAAQNLACCRRDGEGGPKDSSAFLGSGQKLLLNAAMLVLCPISPMYIFLECMVLRRI